MFLFRRAALFLACFIIGVFHVGIVQAKTQLGPKTNYSAADVAGAIRNSGLSPSLMQYANDIGNLARFESGGNTGVYNGTCCTGILQMNRSNLAAQGLTPQQYANMSLQDQVNAWAKLTNSAASSSAVKELIAKGTFDGRKVDGALVLACIQLGTGNCQKMLDSKSCSGFADSNGTTICKMADKIRGGESESADPGDTTKPDETNNETAKPSATAEAILRNAGKCWACTIIVKAGEVTVQVVPKALDSLTRPLMPLMGILFGIVIIFMVGRGFIWPGAMRWTEIFWNFMRFTAVWALLSTANYASEYIMGYAFYPALQAGSTIGEIGGQQFNSAFKGNSNGTNSCIFAPVDGSLPFESRATIEQMATLACNVHTAAYAPVVAGAAMISYKFPASSPSEIATAAAMTVLAAIMIIASLFALAAFAMSVVEALLKLSIVLSLSPIILFLWIFRKTRYLSVNAFNSILYGFFLLAFSGLLASISSFVLGKLVGFGMESSGIVSPQEVFRWINQEIASANVSKLVLFACYCIAGSMMASHLIRAGADMATSLSGVRMGQLTGNVMAGLSSIGQKAFILPAAGTGMLATYAGGKTLAGVAGMGASGMGAIGKALTGENSPLSKLPGLTIKN
jgi:type IV secretory pathway VirB6-like protein